MARAHPFERVLVVGGGSMGVGIAHAFLLAGAGVTVVEVTPELAEQAAAKIRYRVDEGVARGKVEARTAQAVAERLATTHVLADVTGPLDVAIESVPEQADLKREVLRQLEGLNPSLLATNTSALSIDSLATGLIRPEAFLGLHFFNPVWAIELVEIVVGSVTAESTKQAAVALVVELGKQPIVIKDSPGFASSRLGVSLGLEAMRMLEQGVASAADIDRAMELGYKHPVGPLRLTDLVGLDVRLAVARNLAATYGPTFEPPKILVDLVEAGCLGKKSGRGFYEWGEPVA